MGRKNFMEEQKKSTRNRKLVAALCSLVLCMLLIGVSVYAALSQSATITNTISITRSGQSYVTIDVKKSSSNAATAYAATTGEAVGTYDDLLTVAAGQSGTKTDDTQMIFSQAVGKNAYAYKIHLKNESADTAATYTIKLLKAGTTDTAYTSPSAQIVIGKATGDGNVEAYADTTDGELAAGGEVTIYIVVYANVALERLEPTESTDGTTFDLAINTTAKA